VVETTVTMRAALARQDWDVTSSDHAMPLFNALAALALAKERYPAVPFIIVSGEIELNLAVSVMRGAPRITSQKGNWPGWSRRSHLNCAT
jgi:DNA-binding NtrC family response regulator